MSEDPKQIKLAQDYVKQAAKAEKKSFLHKPDPGEAGSLYNKAADIYMKQDKKEEAKDCFEKAAVNYDHDGQSLKSGECYGSAAKAAYLLEQPQEVLRLCQECKVQYLEGDQGMQAVRIMKDLAQKLRDVDPQISFQLYDNLLEIIETSEKYHWDKDSFVDFALLCYDMKNYEECFKAWDRAKQAFLHLKNENSASQCVLSAVAIALERNDIVMAKNLIDAAMQEPYFLKSESFNCIDMIYRGIKNHDGDLLEIGQRNVILGYVKPEIARIICSFKAPKSEPEPPKQGAGGAPAFQRESSATHAAPEADQNAESKEDDDDEDWLR